ncbi:MAG: lamin tail domain-containing protein [Deltaproteobacteria bacterium]|nr:lamin tail domain-containing protein [Deltaproteobacteria bacterium]
MVFTGLEGEVIKKSLFVILLLTSCVQVPLKPGSPNESRPQVLSLWPQNEVISSGADFFIWFSHKIDPATLTEDSLWLIEGEVSPPDQDDFRILKKSVDGGDLKKVSLQMEGVEGGQGVHLKTIETLSPGSFYTLIITPFILSEGRLPVFPYLEIYHTGLEGETERSNELSPGSSPDPADPLEDRSSGEVEAPSSSVAVQGFVVINEILYDVAGSDTNGVLFIELYGTPFFDLGGFKILFVNGDNGEMTDSITVPAGAKVGTDGFYLIADAKNGIPSESFVQGADLIDDFDPQNGPDAVLLFDSNGSLVDSLGYGDLTTIGTAEGEQLFEGDPAPDVAQGHSLERNFPGVDMNNNRDDFVEKVIPTPGV